MEEKLKYIVLCDNDNTEMKLVDYCLVNGYHIDERLLEDVIFKVFIVDGEIQIDLNNESDRGYFEQLNVGKWIQEGISFADEHDVFGPPVDFDPEHYSCVIYDDTRSHDGQSFYCDDDFVKQFKELI